ncbi:MAG: hypothetical protein AAGJ37_17050 [Pseudomonadota bacterium]
MFHFVTVIKSAALVTLVSCLGFAPEHAASLDTILTKTVNDI